MTWSKVKEQRLIGYVGYKSEVEDLYRNLSAACGSVECSMKLALIYQMSWAL